MVNPMIPSVPMRPTKKEMRRRVRRALMLRRLRRELASGDTEIDIVFRRPNPR